MKCTTKWGKSYFEWGSVLHAVAMVTLVLLAATGHQVEGAEGWIASPPRLIRLEGKRERQSAKRKQVRGSFAWRAGWAWMRRSWMVVVLRSEALMVLVFLTGLREWGWMCLLPWAVWLWKGWGVICPVLSRHPLYWGLGRLLEEASRAALVGLGMVWLVQHAAIPGEQRAWGLAAGTIGQGIEVELPSIEAQVRGFVEELDDAMDRWRDEYVRLNAEREAINRKLGQERVDPNLNRRRVVIERKLEAMREGKRDWYLYRYLGGEGFLPGYAFPPQAVALAFDDRENEMARDPDIALTEYAPGNFIYYGGERYEVTHARPRRRRVSEPASGPETELDVEKMLICPACQRAYVGEEETNRAACACGQELIGIHAREGMALTDMYARQRAHITADEEERLRLGYEVTPHYRAGGKQRTYRGSVDGEPAFTLTLEHGGEVLRINRGQREQEGDPRGFTLCQKCHRWLIGEDAPEKHVYTHEQEGECSRNAHPDDLARGLWLTTTIQSDLALFDVPLRALVGEQSEPMPQDEVEAFYTTLAHTLARALMVAFNLDEREINGFLAPSADKEGVPHRIVLYETAVGGSGVLASLAEPGRLATVVERARELLHEGDPEGGCQKACYACLLSFYNQRVHELLDRTLVLPWLQGLEGADNKHPLTVEPVVSEGRFEELADQCQSDLERDVLRAIRERGLLLPDAAQETLYDGDEPLAIADFFYEPKIVVFVDGSPHHRDYVQEADRRKRNRLKGLGYRVTVVKAEDPEAGLDELAARLG